MRKKKKKKKDEIMTCKSVTVGAPYPVTKKKQSQTMRENERTNRRVSHDTMIPVAAAAAVNVVRTVFFSFFFPFLINCYNRIYSSDKMKTRQV